MTHQWALPAIPEKGILLRSHLLLVVTVALDKWQLNCHWCQKLPSKSTFLCPAHSVPDDWLQTGSSSVIFTSCTFWNDLRCCSHSSPCFPTHMKYLSAPLQDQSGLEVPETLEQFVVMLVFDLRYRNWFTSSPKVPPDYLIVGQSEKIGDDGCFLWFDGGINVFSYICMNGIYLDVV